MSFNFYIILFIALAIVCGIFLFSIFGATSVLKFIGYALLIGGVCIIGGLITLPIAIIWSGQRCKYSIVQKDILKGKYHDARESIATFLYETPSQTISHQRLLAFYYFIHCMQKNEKKYNTEEERIDIIYDFCRHMESFTKKNEDKECTSTQEINYNIEDIQKHFNDIFIFSQSENKKDITNKETSEETSQKQQ